MSETPDTATPSPVVSDPARGGLKRSTAILTMATLFLTGVVIGVLLTHGLIAWGLRRPGTVAEWGSRFVTHELDRRLDLTAEQRRQVNEVMAETQREIEEFRERSGPELRAILERGQERIATLLTAEQRREWEEFRRLQRERMDGFWERRFSRGGPHPGPHGPAPRRGPAAPPP